MAGHGVAEAEEVLHDAAFVFFNRAFLLTDVGHCDKFRAAEGTFLLAVGNSAGDFLRDPNEGRHQPGQRGQHDAGGGSELLPEDCAEGFWNDLREDENKKGKNAGDDSGGEGSVAKNFHGLGSYSGGSDGMSHGVEDQDGREGTVDVGGKLLPDLGVFRFRFPLGENVGLPNAQEDGFEDRAKE